MLGIGVPPAKFDGLLEQLRQIAYLHSITVGQKDRTSYFRRINAQRQSAKMHFEAVLKLREAKPASIDDALKLEQKIKEFETELRSLGVQLGDFLGKDSYYQVHLSLVEYQPGDRLD